MPGFFVVAVMATARTGVAAALHLSLGREFFREDRGFGLGLEDYGGGFSLGAWALKISGA